MMQHMQGFRREECTTPTSSYFAPLSTAMNSSKNSHMDLNQNQNEIQNQYEHSNERISTLHTRLQQEAEKIRTWKLQTELDTKQKDKRLQESTQTIESLRKGLLELQIQNENLSLKLQEEMDNRTEIIQRNNATRDMCNVIKDYAAKVEDQLQKCETERTELKYLEKEHVEQFEMLTAEFNNLELTATAKCEMIQDQVVTERRQHESIHQDFEATLERTKAELGEMSNSCESKSVELAENYIQLKENLAKLEQLQSDNATNKAELVQEQTVSHQKQEQIQQLHTEMSAFKESSLSKNDELQIQLDSLRRTNDLQKEEIFNLLARIKEIEDNAIQNEKTLTGRASTIDSLTTQVNSMTKEIEKYKEDLESTRKDVQDTLVREKTSYEKLDELNNNIKKERELKKVEEAKVEEAISVQAELKTELSISKKDFSKLKKELESMKKNKDKLLERVDNMDDEMHKLRQQIEENEVQLKEQEQNSKKLQDELSNTRKFEKDLEKKTKTLADLQEKFKETKADLSLKNKVVKELQKEIEKLKLSLDNYTTNLEITKSKHDVEIKDLTDVYEKYKIMGDKAQMELHNHNEEMKKSVELADIKVADHVLLKKDLDMAQAQLTNIKQNKNSEVNKYEDKIVELSEQLGVKECLFKEKEEQLQECANKEREWVNKEKKMLNVQDKQAEDYSKKENKLQKQLEKSKEDLKAVKDKDKEQCKKVKELEKTTNQLNKTMQETESKLEASENQNTQLKLSEKEKDTKISELEHYKEELKDLKIEKEKLEKTLNKQSKKQLAEIEKLHKKYEKQKIEENLREREQEKENIIENTTMKPSKSKSAPVTLSQSTPKHSSMTALKPVNRDVDKPDTGILETPQKAEKQNSELTKTPQRSILRQQPDYLFKKRRVMFESEDDDESLSDSSMELMEVDVDDMEIRLKNQLGKLCSTPLRVKPSPRFGRSPSVHSPMVTTRTPLIPVPRGPALNRTPLKPVPRGPALNRTPLKPVPRGMALNKDPLTPVKTPLQPVARGEKKVDPKIKKSNERNHMNAEALDEPQSKKIVETPRDNIRKTPNRPQGKFFKSPPENRKKKVPKSAEGNDEINWFDSDVVFGFGVED